MTNQFKIGDRVCWKDDIEAYGMVVGFRNKLVVVNEWNSKVGEYAEHAKTPNSLFCDN